MPYFNAMNLPQICIKIFEGVAAATSRIFWCEDGANSLHPKGQEEKGTSTALDFSP
jgi:hypothetical protein